jgi:hypothetical protein
MRIVFNRVRQQAVLAVLACGAAVPGFAQSTAFPGFTSGNLVVTRTVYTGGPNTVAIGQALPPVCPATAACGTAKATDNGAGPSTSSSNNVWNNNKADGSFGITSPIFIDQMTPAGAVVTTLPVPTNMMVTSFSSKSEMGINLSTDGTVLTMMGYVAPANTIDVSNSNTPGVYDPTNPAGGSYYRGVLQIGANGAGIIHAERVQPGSGERGERLGHGNANGRAGLFGGIGRIVPGRSHQCGRGRGLFDALRHRPAGGRNSRGSGDGERRYGRGAIRRTQRVFRRGSGEHPAAGIACGQGKRQHSAHGEWNSGKRGAGEHSVAVRAIASGRPVFRGRLPPYQRTE